MFDLPKAMSAVADLDSRLEQIANQGRIANGLLALLVLNESNKRAEKFQEPMITEQERLACIALARMAFNDPNSILAQAPEPYYPDGLPVRP